MSPPKRATPKAKAGVTFHAKPGKGDVQLSVLNIRGPFSADTIRAERPPPKNPVKSIITGQTTKNAVSSAAPPQVSMLQLGCFNKHSLTRRPEPSAQRLIGHCPGLRPLCVAGGSPSTKLQDCLMICSLRHQIEKNKKQDAPAVR